MPFDTLIDLMVRMTIMILLGYGLKKGGLITDEVQKGLNALLTKAVMPLNVLAAGNGEYSAQLSKNLALTGAIAVAYYAISLVFTGLLVRPLPMAKEKKGAAVLLSVFSNTAFMGFPVTLALYGAEGRLYAGIFQLVFQLTLFTVGARILSGDEKPPLRQLLLDPLTVSAVLSIVLFLSPFRLPQAVGGAFSEIGAMAVPLSMMIIGCSLVGNRFASLWNDAAGWLVAALRLLVFPLAMTGALWALGFTGVVPAVCVVITALPPAAMNVALAERYGGDVPFTTRSVVQSMALSVVTLPLVVLLAGLVF